MAPKRSGQIVRLEPEGTELLEAYPQMAQRFKDVGWFEFFTTFQGHDEHVSMLFAQNFDGFEVEIGKLLMLVTRTIHRQSLQIGSWRRTMVEKGACSHRVCQSILATR
jgi:hypothetical protein